MVERKRFVQVGAGLAGSLLATLLAKDGHEVEVFEKRPDPRQAGFKGGRSINLALSARGLHGLEQAGLKEEILEIAIPMRGRMIHGRSGEPTFTPYGVDPNQAIFSVSRGELNKRLLDAAEAAGAKIHFEQAATSFDFNSSLPSVTFSSGGSSRTVDADAILGADGAFSKVRSELQRRDRFSYSQYFLSHGYKELHIPPAEGAPGTHRLETHALHIWPRGEFMMIALPNLDGSFTVTLFWPFEGENGFSSLQTEEQVRSFFEATFPDAVPHLPDLSTDYFENPTSSLVTIRCEPWNLGGKVALLGDASHAVVPFYGQGINAGFEDCVVLRQALSEHDDLESAFEAYATSRKPNADALADLCLYNFIEMRQKTASPWFRLKQRVEKTLARIAPSQFQPLYSMVTFSRIPYAEVVRRWQNQERTLQNLAMIGFVVGVALIGTVLVGLALTATLEASG